MMEVNTACVKEFIQMDRSVILQYIVSHLGLSYGTLWRIVVDALQYCKACQMGALCVNRWQQSDKNDGLLQLPAALHSRGKELYASSH
jgi:hypothetical protein